MIYPPYITAEGPSHQILAHSLKQKRHQLIFERGSVGKDRQTDLAAPVQGVRSALRLGTGMHKDRGEREHSRGTWQPLTAGAGRVATEPRPKLPYRAPMGPVLSVVLTWASSWSLSFSCSLPCLAACLLTYFAEWRSWTPGSLLFLAYLPPCSRPTCRIPCLFAYIFLGLAKVPVSVVG